MSKDLDEYSKKEENRIKQSKLTLATREAIKLLKKEGLYYNGDSKVPEGGIGFGKRRKTQITQNKDKSSTRGMSF
jgi:hypothetical protein